MPSMSMIIDRINLSEMRKASSVHHYSQEDALSPAEQAALDSVADEVRGKRILDIGVGGGRTVKPLLRVSRNYLGVDNSPAMIEAVTRRFPGVSFKDADARAMTDLADGSIDMAMFSCNGIGMVAHEDRLAIMREVHRVLKPGGLFLFSTHNQRCPDHTAGLKFPEFHMSANPAKALVRAARFSWRTYVRVQRRFRMRKHEVRTSEYSMINDVCHDYGVMLYYITLENQRRQLERMGFGANAEAFDLTGAVADRECDHSSLMLVARKP